MDRKASLIIIDSDTAFRKAVRQQLGDHVRAEVVGEAENATAGHELILKTQPQIVLLELPQRPEKALEWATQWRSEFPGMQMYAVSATKNPDLILAAMRAGMSEYLSKPLEIKEFHAALDKSLRILETEARNADQSGRIIAVFSKKGGLGVTTLAVNLAVALGSGQDSKVVLVDMAFDLGDVASHLDIRPKFAMADVLDKHGQVDASNLQSSLLRHTSGVYYLGEREMAGEPQQISPDQVHQVLMHLKQSFRYVVLDLPHSFDTHTYEAFQLADRILVIATSDLSTMRATRYALKVFRSLGYDTKKVHVVLNRVSKKDAVTSSQFADTLEYPVSFEIPSDYRSVIESINSGEPLILNKPKSEVSKSLARLADMYRVSGDGPVAEAKPGLFRRALGGS